MFRVFRVFSDVVPLLAGNMLLKSKLLFTVVAQTALVRDTKFCFFLLMLAP